MNPKELRQLCDRLRAQRLFGPALAAAEEAYTMEPSGQNAAYIRITIKRAWYYNGTKLYTKFQEVADNDTLGMVECMPE
jgi:hypothetical protein